MNPHQRGNSSSGNRELVRLSGLDDEFAPVASYDAARDLKPKIAVTQAIVDDLNEELYGLTKLWSAVFVGS
jgi:hypothetical protein